MWMYSRDHGEESTRGNQTQYQRASVLNPISDKGKGRMLWMGEALTTPNRRFKTPVTTPGRLLVTEAKLVVSHREELVMELSTAPPLPLH